MKESKHMNGVYINEKDTYRNYLHMSIKSKRVKKIPRHCQCKINYMSS